MRTRSNSLTATERHDATVDLLVEKLLRKQRNGVEKFVIEYSDRHTVTAEYDILVSEERNGVQYLTYYEIKTGESYKKDVRKQARRFFNLYKGSDAVCTFIAYHPNHGVVRWLKDGVERGKRNPYYGSRRAGQSGYHKDSSLDLAA